MQFLAAMILLALVLIIAVSIRLALAWLVATLFTWLTGLSEVGGVAVLHIAIGLALASMLFFRVEKS